MNKNIIGIDPSLICTAMVVNNKKFVYTGDHIAYTKKGRMVQWFERVDDIITLRSFLLSTKFADHTKSELHKISKYQTIVDSIITDIISEIGVIDDNCFFGIEGYSYSSASGPLIDLVTFGTILKTSLIRAGAANIIIVPPQELKNKAASLVYPAIKKGKTTMYRNGAGLAGGSFKKPDMMLCLLEDPKLVTDEWILRLKEYEDDLVALKNVPKPIEDLNDAKLLYEWIERNL